MTDFETHPIGTAKRIEKLEKENMRLSGLMSERSQMLRRYDQMVVDGAKREEAWKAKLAKVVAVLHSIVDQRGYADDPWGIVQSALAELKGGTNGKD